MKGRLRPGGEKKYKELSLSWNTLSALGQKKMPKCSTSSLFASSVYLPQFLSLSPHALKCQVCLCGLLSIVSCPPLLYAAVPVFVGVCGSWRMFLYFLLLLWLVMSCFTGAHQKIRS